MAVLKETGESRPTLEERFEVWKEEIRAEGRAEGYAQGYAQGFAQGFAQGLAQVLAQSIERSRARLQLLTERKFGAATAAELAPLLASMEDPGQLDDVADWIIDCANWQELLARLQSPA